MATGSESRDGIVFRPWRSATPKGLSDPYVRSFVIRHEHPEFEDGSERAVGSPEDDDGPVSRRLHLTMHEIVATQLWDHSPPEVWDTAVRLL